MLDEAPSVELFRERAQRYHHVTTREGGYCKTVFVSVHKITSFLEPMHKHDTLSDNALLSHGTLHAASGSEI